jgi:peptidoglycan/xylan/chitin deacetylase (PgdA/CDA1 family)
MRVDADGGRNIRRRSLEPEVLVLCYHAVSERWDADLSVTPRELRRQLTGLLSQGWVGAAFTDAVLRPAHRRTLAVTFDDAFESVLTLAAPLLAELGLPATVFVPTDWVGKSLGWPEAARWAQTEHSQELRAMSWDALRGLSSQGWEIGAHTRSHPHLTRLESAALRAELHGSRVACEQEIGSRCRSIAYPFGDVDGRVRAAAVAAGYEVAAGLSAAAFASSDRFNWPRVGVWHEDPYWRFRLKVSPTTLRVRRRWPAVIARAPKRGHHDSTAPATPASNVQ